MPAAGFSRCGAHADRESGLRDSFLVNDDYVYVAVEDLKERDQLID